MGTTTLKELMQNFSEQIGDYLTFATTDNIGAGTTVVSTDLQQYDGSGDDYFGDWWVYIDGTNNSGVLRQIVKVGGYATATGTLTVRGANLSSESGSVTCYLHRYNRDFKKLAINRSIEQVYPLLHKRVNDKTLVTGNLLFDGHFEDWTSSSALRFASGSSTTLVKTTTAGLHRGPLNTTSAKSTASGSNGYILFSSINNPRMKDIAGKSASLEAWVYPQTADDVTVILYTKNKAGTEQTKTSTTTAVASVWTKLKLLDQSINDDLTLVEVRLNVVTSGQNAYWDDARLVASETQEYLLPVDLRGGHVSQVNVQTRGEGDRVCDDVFSDFWDSQEFRTPDDGTYSYIRLNALNGNWRRIELIGYTPLSTMSSDTDSTEVSGERENLLIAKAAVILYRLLRGPVSSEDVSSYTSEIRAWEIEYRSLSSRLGMTTPAETIYTGRHNRGSSWW